MNTENSRQKRKPNICGHLTLKLVTMVCLKYIQARPLRTSAKFPHLHTPTLQVQMISQLDSQLQDQRVKPTELVDILLKPYISKVQSNIRDTAEFLNTIPEKINPESILFYLILQNCILIFHVILDLLPQNSGFPNLLHLHTIIRYSNGNETKVAPIYATLVLDYLKEKLFQTFKRDLVTTIKPS